MTLCRFVLIVEPVLADLLCDDCLRELPNYRQLIAEVTIERLEVVRQDHCRQPAPMNFSRSLIALPL